MENPSFPAYDILVITKDRSAEILRALRSVTAQTIPPASIIVIDASCDDKTEKAVSGFSKLNPHLKIEYSRSETAGTTHQRNRGLEKAQSDIILFMDDDVVLTPGLSHNFLSMHAKYPHVAAVSGLEVNHAVQSRLYEAFCRFFLMNGKTTVRGSYIKPSGFCCINEAGPNKEEFFCTCCVSVRRSALGKHRFDENLGSYAFMEDVDFSIPLGRRYTILRNPEAKFYHYRSPAGRIGRRDRQARYIFNHYYIYRKHIPKNPLTAAAHIWSNFGLMIESGYNTFKEKTPDFLIGTIAGYGQIFRHILTNKFPR
jgi:GT2 family glycosyltransferase